MKSVVILVSLLFMTTNAFDYDEEENARFIRASAGAYGGVINGQHFGGSYYTPDDGPTVHHRYGNGGSGQDSSGSSSNRNKPSLHNRFSDEPSGSSNRPSGGGGSFAGASAGSFSGSGPGSNFGPPPYYPFQGPDAQPFRNPFEFNDFLQNFFSTFNNNLATTFQKNLDIQRNAYNAATQAFNAASQQRFGGAPNINHGSYSGGGAFSSASFGPGGGHQSAGIYPENNSKPNVHTRFGNDDSRPGGGKPGGVVGISTSSFSSTSDVNGKKTTRKQATTSINENGKVTTYTVED